MKNKKIKLSELKVKSFITELDKSSENTVVGRGLLSLGKWCTNNPDCFAEEKETKGLFCTTRDKKDDDRV